MIELDLVWMYSQVVIWNHSFSRLHRNPNSLVSFSSKAFRASLFYLSFSSVSPFLSSTFALTLLLLLYSLLFLPHTYATNTTLSIYTNVTHAYIYIHPNFHSSESLFGFSAFRPADSRFGFSDRIRSTDSFQFLSRFWPVYFSADYPARRDVLT